MTESILGKGHPALNAFRAEVSHAVDVRDILEHFDAYAEGRRNLRESGRVERKMNAFVSGDMATSTRRIHIGRVCS